jgi:outer membrane protein
MTRTASLLRLAGATGLVLAAAAPARADTLREALAAAYRDNPTLTAARARQRANDENVPIQRAAGLPSAQASVQYSQRVEDHPDGFFGPSRTLSGTVSLSVPVYSGGRVRNAVRSARLRVDAGQYDLRSTELNVFAQVVGAYMDMIRDGAIVSLNEQNVGVLEVNLRATRDRFEVGDLTRTDVAQSESRLALAQSDLKTARATLIQSRERYVQLVGRAPAELAPPPPLPGLPASPEDAVTVAVASNPDLAAARKDREAAGVDVTVAKADRLPEVSAFGQGSSTDYLQSRRDFFGRSAVQRPNDVLVGATLTLPLYQGGRPAARVRQSREVEAQALETETAIERDVVAQTRSFYASWQASLDVIESSKTAVSASALSLEGVRAENTVGSRTILDILDAEQEALRARVSLVSAERNAYVAAFNLLASMGRVTAVDLGLDGGALYNPVTHYKSVSGNWWDWGDGKPPQAQATRTVDTPAQNADVAPDPNGLQLPPAQ